MSNDGGNNTVHDGMNGKAKRRRGRPKGSQNKAKSQPEIPGRSIDDKPTCCSSFHPHLIEIPEGSDVSDAIISFASRHSGGCGGGVCVLSASGPIAKACIYFPSLCQHVLLTAPCQLLSITAIFLPGGGKSMSACFRRLQGQAIWGKVAGPLMAAGKVDVVVTTFGTSEAGGDFSVAPSAVRAAGIMDLQTLPFEFFMEADNGAVVARNGGETDIFKAAAAYFPGGYPSLYG
ncbi:hypothetical protein HPP92_009134 [Vanilla planifolia]|uniref:PPC domain-containing protein n=1 Tax=Vanilla planifolia TaxID=51239 RepID=A0A835R9Q7_VANPL|nr:hypothetical protein HPP92_009134 [Vanilla planifolia]